MRAGMSDGSAGPQAVTVDLTAKRDLGEVYAGYYYYFWLLLRTMVIRARPRPTSTERSTLKGASQESRPLATLSAPSKLGQALVTSVLSATHPGITAATMGVSTAGNMVEVV